MGERHLETGSAIEMSWKTFAGEYEVMYELLLRNRAEVQGELIENMQLGDLLRAHISRGISRLTAMKSGDSLNDMLLLYQSGIEPDQAQ